MAEIHFPTVDHVVAFNHLALALVKVKRADKPLVLSRSKLIETVEKCQNAPGDIYDKAVILLTEIIRKHPFASGNRRTAFLVMVDFLFDNNAPCRLKNDPENARVLLGIREGFYTPEELKGWIRHGKIRPFKR